uniref:Cytochrome P450 n=1 Tax=Timema cristinae TaxID=61476 RepID=A0A7R9CBX5_TIMCR|nr:unnamed protein product [Timema cristinae]
MRPTSQDQRSSIQSAGCQADDRKSTQNSQFLVIPYGCGRRMCPGKRFVDQELHLILAKIVQEFEVKFDGEMGLQFEFFLAPGGPVNFTFIDRH